MSQIKLPTNTSALDRLPAPIVSDIFVLTWCTWEYESKSTWGNITRFSVPYVLASVSCRWRTIALSTSMIWTFVELPRRPRLIADHLARSRKLPLDIDIELAWTGDEDLDEGKVTGVQESLRILKETNSWARIGQLDAQLSFKLTSSLLDDFNAVIDGGPTCTVQTINIQPFDPDSEDDKITGFVELFLHIPDSQSLRWVNLESVAVSPVPHLPSSPLLGLEHLDIKSTSIQLSDSFFPLLDLTPNLVNLWVDSCWVLPGTLAAAKPRPRHSILLPKLKTLKLDCAGRTGPNMLFQTLDMPNLEFLDIMRVDQDTDLDWGAVCNCRALEHLVLMVINYEVLLRLLPEMRNLARLKNFSQRIQNYDAPGGFVDQLVLRLFDTAYCPALQNLDLAFSLDRESMEMIEKLRPIRPSLDIFYYNKPPPNLIFGSLDNTI